MPIQDNEVSKQPEIEADAHKSETLLPIFHMAYGSHMDTLNHLQERKAETQDQIKNFCISFFQSDRLCEKISVNSKTVIKVIYWSD